MEKIICQIWIMVFGCSAIWLVGRLEHWKRWGYIFGLLGQPVWFYTAIIHEQWGIAVISLWYTYSWGHGVYNYWIKVKIAPDEKLKIVDAKIKIQKNHIIKNVTQYVENVKCTCGNVCCWKCRFEDNLNWLDSHVTEKEELKK